MNFKNKIKEVDQLQQEINSHRPLKKDALDLLKDYYRIGLTYSSNAIEGNSITESETKVIIEDGLTIGGKTIKEHMEVIGHNEAFDLLFELSTSKEITEKDIQELHRHFYYRIDEQNAGSYRKKAVFISGTDFIPPKHTEVPALMKEFAESIPALRENNHPVEFASLLHGEFVTIHPFVDGNGRTARLLMNLGLLQQGYVMTIIPPVLRSTYNETLRDYNKGKKKPFIDLVSAMVYESQKDYLRLLNHLEE
ncbi:MAG: Fic family protein [bacterium]|nr:Fic family protein [bacterium]